MPAMPRMYRGAMDGKAFEAYVEQVLMAELEPGTVVIQDNLATHKTSAYICAFVGFY